MTRTMLILGVACAAAAAIAFTNPSWADASPIAGGAVTIR